MRIKTIFSIGSAIFAVATACSSAIADLTVVNKSVFDYSKMRINGQPVSQDQIKMIQGSLAGAGVGNTTSYYSGKRAKISTTGSTVLLDLSSNQMTILMAATKTYMTMPMNGGMFSNYTQGMQSSIKDLGQTKTILGHTAHLMKYYAKNALMTISGYVWVAPDLTEADSFQKMSQSNLTGLKGLAMKASVEVSSPSMFGALSTKTEVTSLSTDPVPTSTFDMPSDYKAMNMNGLK
jgi:hypothetical protein